MCVRERVGGGGEVEVEFSLRSSASLSIAASLATRKLLISLLSASGTHSLAPRRHGLRPSRKSAMHCYERSLKGREA